ncbi:hypothetical protein NKH77_25445 [Streptomyces sp. M19]
MLAGLALPHLQVAEALAALGPVPRAALAGLLDVTGTVGDRELDTALETLADRALVWPDSERLLHMAAPLRQAWDSPLGFDAPLARLLADMTSEELRRILVALGIPSPGTAKKQRLTALLAHHSDPERVAAVVASAPAATRQLLERRARHQGEQPEKQAEFIMLGAPSADPSRVRAGRWSGVAGSRPALRVRARACPGRGGARAARGRLARPFDPVPPMVRLVSVTLAEADREAASAAMAFAGHAASVLGRAPRLRRPG